MISSRYKHICSDQQKLVIKSDNAPADVILRKEPLFAIYLTIIYYIVRFTIWETSAQISAFSFDIPFPQWSNLYNRNGTGFISDEGLSTQRNFPKLIG